MYMVKYMYIKMLTDLNGLVIHVVVLEPVKSFITNST